MRRLLAFLFAPLLLCAGCAAGTAEPCAAYLFAMDTYMELRVWGPEELVSEAGELLTDLEARLSVTDPDSEISGLNRTGEADLSADTAALLAESLALCRRTAGALDLTVYPLVRAWGFTGDAFRVPAPDEIEELLARVGYEDVDLTGTHAELPAGAALDLGSVAKGYAGRRIAERLRAAGVTSALLNLGGNVQTVGAKPDGSPWRVAIRDPDGEGLLGTLDVEDLAVVTSGGYERCFTENGVTYWHILDPATGYPAKNGLVSVTVAGADGLVCDALSTALFVMGPERAADFWRESGDFEAVLVTEDGAILITEGLADCFAPMEDYSGAEVTVIRRG